MMFMLSDMLEPDAGLTTGMPHWMRWVIWIAWTLAALAVIWKHSRKPVLTVMTKSGEGMLRYLNDQWTPNSGHSAMDKLDKAVTDSATAVVQNTRLEKKMKRVSNKVSGCSKRIDSLGGIVGQVKGEHDEMYRTVASIKAEQEAVHEALARKIVHDANNTLCSSSLLAQEKVYLEQVKQQRQDDVSLHNEDK